MKYFARSFSDSDTFVCNMSIILYTILILFTVALQLPSYVCSCVLLPLESAKVTSSPRPLGHYHIRLSLAKES